MRRVLRARPPRASFRRRHRRPLQPGSTPAEPPAPRPTTTGGVDVYRINPSGAPEKVWTNPRDTVYAIAFDRGGHAILGAGNKGTLYRIDSNSLSTALLNVASTQITSLVTGNDGAFYASTGNVGKVFRFGPDPESSGTLESDVFDSTGFSQWGRLKAEGTGKIELFSRSGNVDRPHENWSAWAPVKERSASPPSRFLQWKAVLSAGAELDSVEAAYLPKNVAPRIEEIEITPPNYRLTPPVTDTPPSAPAAAISLPALGKKPPQGTAASSLDPAVAMTYSKGWIGARWNASDQNGDALQFTVEIRGEQEKQWRPLAGKIREKHYTFDSTAFPDGEYRLRITASDSPGNVEAEALHTEADSPPFYIDNTPPEISGLSARRKGTGLQAGWKVTDALSVIQRAEYSLDDGDWNLVEPTGKLSDSLSLSYELAIPTVSGGEHVLAVRATDEYGNQVVSKAVAN
jgi:hypothetical protein